MSTEKVLVKVRLSDDSLTHGSFTLHDEIPSDPDEVQVDLSFLERKESAVARDFFEALAQLRKKLEAENIWLLCNGAVENVYPSAMARSMGGGLKAYKLTLGKQAKTEDMVSIFEGDLGLPPSPVRAQQAFYQVWIRSLNKT
jgi:hypothetical protein